MHFNINKARQFGKTTTLQALVDYLKEDYTVFKLDFQRVSYEDFVTETAFVNGVARKVHRRIRRMDHISDNIKKDI